MGEQDGGTITGCNRTDDVIVEALARGNSINTALRVRSAGIIGFHTGGSYSGCSSILNNNIKAWYDQDSGWTKASSSNCNRDAIAT